MTAKEFLNYLFSMKISISEIKETVIDNANRSICWEQHNHQDFFLRAEFAEETAVFVTSINGGFNLGITYQAAEEFKKSMDKLHFGDIIEREIVELDSDEPESYYVERKNGVEVNRINLSCV